MTVVSAAVSTQVAKSAPTADEIISSLAQTITQNTELLAKVRPSKSNSPDIIGRLAAQISLLDAEMKRFKEHLKGLGDGEYKGVLFKVDVSTYETASYNKDKIEALFTEPLLEQLKSTSTRTSVTPRPYKTA